MTGHGFYDQLACSRWKVRFQRTSADDGRYLVMDDEYPTPVTLEFPPEPEPLEELTDEDVIDERPIVTLH